VEEVARHYGYEKFPSRLPAAKEPARRLPHAAALDRVRERLIGLGYQEIVEIPLVDARRDELFRPTGVTAAIIGNPLAEDASVMRSSGVVSMLSALEWNLNHHQRNLRLFEIGKQYELRAGEPVETAVVTLGATGLARDKTIHEAAREFSFADLKGDLDRLGELAGGFAWHVGGPGWLAGGRSAEIWVGTGAPNASGRALGLAGQLARGVADQFKLRQDIFLAELWLDSFLGTIDAARSTLRFVPIPRFPAVGRDFSLVLADGITFAQVAQVIRALSIQELQRVEAADLFRGGQVPAGKFSLMVRVIFQSAQTTLTDAQTAEFSSRIVGALEQQLGATLRTS
jgi:phenylalanyl-tRNA synthetase beta chain